MDNDADEDEDTSSFEDAVSVVNQGSVKLATFMVVVDGRKPFLMLLPAGAKAVVTDGVTVSNVLERNISDALNMVVLIAN